MTTQSPTPDITVRGGLIYFTNPDKHHLPTRHQPDTPINKKKVTPRADHQAAPTKTPAPPVSAPEIPDGEKPDEPTETSQSD